VPLEAFQYVVKDVECDVDLSLRDIKRRQEPYGFKAASEDQQSLFEGLFKDAIPYFVAGDGDGHHQPQPPRVVKERMPRLNVCQAVQEMTAHSRGVVQKVFLLNDLDHLIPHPGADGVSLAPCRSDPLGLPGKYVSSAEGGPNPKRLGRGNNVRSNVKVLTGPPFSGSSQTALYLITDKGYPVGLRNRGHLSDEIGVGDIVAAFPEDRLDDDVGDLVRVYQADLGVEDLGQSADDPLSED